MQSESERIREREPEVRDPGHKQHEKRFLRWEEARQRIESLPRVIKFADLPWQQNQQAQIKSFVGSLFLDEFLAKGPTYTVAANEQIIAPSSKSGRHRHFEEAIFYVIDGKGWELHDGVDYPWEAGDVFCVPSYSVHQHNTYADSTARLFFCVGPVWSAMGLGEQFVEFHDLHPLFGLPEGAEPLHGDGGALVGYKRSDGVEIHHEFQNSRMKDFMEAKWQAADTEVEPSSTLYDEYVNAWVEEATWRKHVPHVVKGADRPWEDTPMGRIKWMIHPKIPSPLKTFEAFIQEIPPGGKTGMHRHVSEEIHKVLDGEGYVILDGEEHEWVKDDVICIPMFVAHQHVNTDSRNSAHIYSVRSTFYDFTGHSGIQHLEDAPEYRRANGSR